jgi:hypothetical protein
MDIDAFIELVAAELKGLSRYFVDDDYLNAANDASRETGWGFPLSADFRIQWAKQRTKRHLFFMLLSESAHKFKYEQINLQHRFEHYNILIANMDKAFKEVMEERPEEFLDVMGISDSVGLMGTKVDAGFSYTEAGEDSTYDVENVVNFSPSKN